MDVLTSPEFTELKRSIMALIREETMKAVAEGMAARRQDAAE